MRRLLFVAAIAALCLAHAALADPAAAVGSQGYRLDIGDQLRIKVFEWRSSVGDVHEWTALNGAYDVGADGAIAMPLLGALKAVGQTTDQLADTISTQLQTRFGLTIRPQASIEIIQYRPFYILGDVGKPGEYPYQPGLTVLQAISIAGGRYRVNDPALLLTTAGDLRVYRLQYDQLLARRARLEAELNEANAITFPPELLRVQNDPKVAELIQREQSIFTSRRDAMTSQLNALNQLKSLLNSEVAALQDKMKNMDQELALMKGEVNNTANLVQRGLAIAPREYTLRETELDTEGRRLDLDTAALRAKEDIGKADEAIVELRNKTRDQIQTDLADAEQKISETAARIATGSMIVDRESSTDANSAQGEEEAIAHCVILRRDEGKTKELQADETALIEPGDTIKVLRAVADVPGANSAASAAADDPPPAQAAPPSRPPPKPGNANAQRSAPNEPKAGSRP
jgi:polysaccharide biosynthesis/export protein ExoF